jgi:hypothetical protein
MERTEGRSDMPEVVFRGKNASVDWALKVLEEAGVDAWVVEPRAEMTPYHRWLRVYHVAVADGAGEAANRALQQAMTLEAPRVAALTREAFDAGVRALAAPLVYVILEMTVLGSSAAVVIAGSLFIWVVAFMLLARRMAHGRDAELG